MFRKTWEIHASTLTYLMVRTVGLFRTSKETCEIDRPYARGVLYVTLGRPLSDYVAT